MLLQTNSYIVPKDKRAEHARLLRRFRASLAKLGCDSFEVYEQVGSNWTTGEPTGRYVQIMRFRDRRHQLSVQAAERSDPGAQAIIAEFCQLINFPYQQQQGLFAVGFYNSVLPVAPSRPQAAGAGAATADAHAEAPAVAEAPAHDEAPAPDHDAASVAPEGEYAEVEQGADGDDVPEDAGGAVGEVDSPADAEAREDLEELNTPAAEVETDEQSDLATPLAGDVDGTEGEDAADLPDDGQDAGAGEAGATNGEAVASTPNEDELGSLLDSHLDSRPEADGAEHAEGAPTDADTAAEDGPVGLDALDLDALDLPDAPSTGPQHASKHVAH